MRSPRIYLAAMTLAFTTAFAVLANLPADEPILRRDDRIARRGEGREYDQERVQLLQQWADKLASELEYVMEDITQRNEPQRNEPQRNEPQRNEPQRNEGARELYEQVDVAMHEVARFQKSLRPESSREHVYRDFQTMDKQVRALLESSQFTKDASLRARIARVGYAEQQLHQAMSSGDQSETVRSDSLTRQARALEMESKQLAEAARTALVDNRRSEETLAAINQFAEEAERFDRIVEKNASPRQVLRDFAAVDQSWATVVNQLNQSGRNAYLFRRAQRVETIYNQLHTLLDAQTERAPIEYRVQD